MSLLSAIDVVSFDDATAILLPWLVMTSPECKEAVLLEFRSSCLFFSNVVVDSGMDGSWWSGSNHDDDEHGVVVIASSIVLLVWLLFDGNGLDKDDDVHVVGVVTSAMASLV